MNTVIIAIVVLCSLAVITVITITFVRPKDDNTPIFTAIFGMLLPVITTLVAAALQIIHKGMNSTQDKLIKTTIEKSKLSGRQELLDEQEVDAQSAREKRSRDKGPPKA
jgi:hypothetical protein